MNEEVGADASEAEERRRLSDRVAELETAETEKPMPRSRG